MRTQTESLNGSPRTSPPHAVAKDAGDVIQDFMSLAELQTSLLKTDAARSLRYFGRVVIMFALALVIGLSCLPIALMTLAYGLHENGWSLAISFATATAIGILMAALCGVAGWIWYHKSPPMFVSSRRELKENISWLRHIVTRRSPTRR